MAVDKGQIKPILEGQSGREVADNMLANFKFLADEIDNGGNSGGGGTTDYPQLTNKPKINGVELNGNKTSTQLGIPTQEEVNGKQPKLISGTNIKTINGNSILGSGNIQISGGGGASVNVVDDLLSTSSTDALSARQGKILKQEIEGKQPIGNYATQTYVQEEIEKAQLGGGGGDSPSGGVTPSQLKKAVEPISDKTYSVQDKSGMGRINLPKGNGILTKEQTKFGDTVYIVQYDLDLNGQVVNIGANSTLRFNGGSLKNGTIAFNNTLIEGNAKFVDVRPLGTLANEDIRMDWFDKSNDTYDTAYIKDFISFSKDNKHHYIIMSHRHLKPINCIVSQFSNLTFIGDKVTSIVEIPKELDRRSGAWGLGFILSKNINFKGVKYIAPNCESITDLEGRPQNIMYATPVVGFDRCEDCGVVNCSFTEMPYVSPILLKQPKHMTIIHNSFVDYDSGIILHQDGDNTGVESEDAEVYSVKIADNYFAGTYNLSEPITFKSNRIFKLDIINNYIANKLGAAGIALKLLHSKSECLIMGNIMERCGYGIGLEKSKCNYLIMNNKFISNQWCQVDVYDNANCTLQGNYFVGTKKIVTTEANREATDAHISLIGNIFENSGDLVGKCNYIVSNNQYVGCKYQPSITTEGNITFVGNQKDASSTFTKVIISYRKSEGNNKLIIRDNGFGVSLLGINDANIDSESEIELEPKRAERFMTKSEFSQLATKRDNTLYFITQ